MTKQEQGKIALPISKFQEIKTFSNVTGIPMAQVITRLWDKFKESPNYAKSIVLGKDL